MKNRNWFLASTNGGKKGRRNVCISAEAGATLALRADAANKSEDPAERVVINDDGDV